MKKHINLNRALLRLSLFPALLILASLTVAARPSVTLKQSLDSAWLLMGRVTPLNIELVADGLDGRLVIPDKAYPAEVEIAGETLSDTTDLGNGRYEIRRQLMLQSFDSGFYELPQILWIKGNDTVKSNRLGLKVVPVEVDSLQDIHPYVGALDAGTRWYDWMPDWLIDYWLWMFLGLVAIGLAIWYYLKHRNVAVGADGLPLKKEQPYDVAIRELDRLRSEKLCEAGREKEFYTRLTDILRVYLHDRFGINAMEMTSTQIIDSLRSNPDTRLSEAKMREVLQMADFVKFAKMRPLPDDNAGSLRSAMQFVEDTKPAVDLEDIESGQAPDSQH